MSSRSKILTATASVFVASLALVGCTINVNVPPNNRDGGDMMNSQQNAAGFSGRDLMFAQMMIPHHEQAVEMSTLAETRSTNPELLALAKQIKDAQAPEIVQMQGWLDASGDAGGMGGMGEMNGMDHSGHGMGGMLSEEQMHALTKASGAEFDRLWLEGMIEHHEGALQMTRMIEDSSNPEVKKLADDIIRTQTAEIKQMKQMLATMGA